jgi:hypothetical protein
MRFKPVFIAVALLIPLIANAILPAFAVAWLISGTNLVLIDGALVGISALTGALWYDCNGFTSLSSCKNNSSNVSTATNNNDGGKKYMEVKLLPEAARKNPDSTKFNDPVPPSRDVTPKASYVSAATVPGNGSYAAIASAGLGKKTYQNSDGSVIDVDVIQIYQSGMTTAQASTAGQTNTAAAHVGMNYTSVYTISSTDWRAIWHKNRAPTCDTGYTLTGSNCILSNSLIVKKPTTTTCEVLYLAGTQTFQFDSSNSNCDGFANDLISGSTLQSPANSTGQKMAVTPLSNGGFQFTAVDPDGSWKTVSTSSYNSAAGGYPVTTSTSGSGGTPNASTGTTSTGTGSGTSGSGTSSGGSCGGIGQTKCAIDDSGLTGQTLDIAPHSSAVDTAHNNVMSAIASKMPSAPTWGWSLPIQPVSCQPITLTIYGRSMLINWCSYILVMQQALSFLAYCLTAFHLFGLVIRPAPRN